MATHGIATIQFIKTIPEHNDRLTAIVSMKIGVNQVYILLDGGLDGQFGT